MGRGWWLLVASLLSCGCGSRTELALGEDPTAPSCGGQSGCGGELFGRWRALATCNDLAFVAAVLPCDGIVIREQSPQLSGYKSYSREGSYTSRLRYSGSVRMFVPESCSDLRAGAASCTVLGELMLRRGELLLSEVSCGSSDGGCTCEASLLPLEREDSGTYTAREGHLSEQTGSEGDYCVEGDTLRFSPGGGAQEQLFLRD